MYIEYWRVRERFLLGHLHDLTNHTLPLIWRDTYIARALNTLFLIMLEANPTSLDKIRAQ